MRWWLATALLLGAPGMAQACTVCDSSTGRQVRAGIEDGHFLATLTLVLLPFAVLALAAVGIYFGMPDLSTGEGSVRGMEGMPAHARALPAEGGGQRAW